MDSRLVILWVMAGDLVHAEERLADLVSAILEIPGMRDTPWARERVRGARQHIALGERLLAEIAPWD